MTIASAPEDGVLRAGSAQPNTDENTRETCVSLWLSHEEAGTLLGLLLHAAPASTSGAPAATERLLCRLADAYRILSRAGGAAKSV